MRLEPFELERVQSVYENTVEYNLTESGIYPFTLEELLDEQERDELMRVRIGYGQTNGANELRDAIGRLYPGAGRDNVLVTHGSIEANLAATLTLLHPGDELVLMLPNYMQIWGLARAQGVSVKAFTLREELGWLPDMDELRRLVTPATKMIAVCNPNNPTGAVLPEAMMDDIAALADSVGAMLYADEIYRGEEVQDEQITPSFHGRSEKTMVTGSLSKAFGLAGLRIGWLVGSTDDIEACWRTRDYTTISTAWLSNHIALKALQPERLERILKRSRRYLRDNLTAFQRWAEEHQGLFSYIPPRAGGFVFVRYGLDMESTALSDALREQESVFVVPGSCFGLDRFIRIGIGSQPEYFLAGLERFQRFLERAA